MIQYCFLYRHYQDILRLLPCWLSKQDNVCCKIKYLKEYLKKLTLLHLRPIALAKKEISDSAIRRLMVAAGDDVSDLLTLCRADITTKNPNKIKKYLSNFERVESKMSDVSERDKMKAFQSPVRGKEIMKILNLEPGKAVGKIKSEIEEAILDGKIENSYDQALEYLMSIKNRKS